MTSQGDMTGWEAVKELRRKAAMEALEIETEKALERRAEIARCRAAFAEAYRSGKIYAIEYIYRVSGWGYPDKKGRCQREYGVKRGRMMPYMESIGFVPHSVTPCGVMVAVRDGDYLAFGASALDLVDKWNKYIGLEMALRRALGEGMRWPEHGGSRYHPSKFVFESFCAEQRERLRGDIALRDHGDRRGIVTTTARGDTRVEMPVMRPGDYMFMGNIGYHHNPQSTGAWLGLKTDPPAQPSPIIAVEPEPAIIKPGELKEGDVLKITATGSVYREVKK